MKYINKIELLNSDMESMLFHSEVRNIFNTKYPTGIFPHKNLNHIEFNDVTIFAGGNGSGKSTLLHMLAKKVKAKYKENRDFGSIFDIYVKSFNIELNQNNSYEIKYLSSDDIFEYMLDLRAMNTGVNRRKADLKDEYISYKYRDGMDYNNYDELKKIVDSRSMTLSKYTRTRLSNNNIVEKSNGESAIEIWQNEITENGVYILDEPENSLSIENQIKLKQFIEESVRFYNCQFIIATHSVFLQNIKFAKIYDLDCTYNHIKKWEDLSQVKATYNFFNERNYLFLDDEDK